MASGELDTARIAALLERDAFRNVVLLKTMNLHAHRVRVFYFECAGKEAALLLLPTEASLFDARGYPQTEYVVMIYVTHPNMLKQVMTHIPQDCSVVFKLCDDFVREALAEQWKIRRTAAYVSYTTSASQMFAPDPQVVRSTQMPQECFELLNEAGHPRAEVLEIFANGEAAAFTLWNDNKPSAVCFTFQNYQAIHEIGGLYTLPAERRKGLARRLVTTALADLTLRGKTPRYVVHESNHASAQLAKSLGLHPVVTMEHWLHTKEEG